MGEPFHFSKLSRQAKSIYRALDQKMTLHPPKNGVYHMRINNVTSAMSDAADAMQAIHLDKPEYFFLSTHYEISLLNDRLTITCPTLYSPNQIKRLRPLLINAISQLTAGLENSDEWERERCVYERIFKTKTYGNINEPENQNILNAALRNRGVCSGYSKLLALALRNLKIPCILVSGYGENENHCWNMVKIDGKVYHVDITWEPDLDGHCDYSYFNLTDSEIKRDHIVYTKGLPSANSINGGFHFRKGTLFSNKKEAVKFVEKSLWSGEKVVRVRLTDNISVMSFHQMLRSLSFCSYKSIINEKRNSVMIIRD